MARHIIPTHHAHKTAQHQARPIPFPGRRSPSGGFARVRSINGMAHPGDRPRLLPFPGAALTSAGAYGRHSTV